MTPQAIPDAPAAMRVLSSTSTSRPLPRPLSRNAFARCQAVLRPWMPAPTTRYFVRVGKAMLVIPRGDWRHRLGPGAGWGGDLTGRPMVAHSSNRFQTNLNPIDQNGYERDRTWSDHSRERRRHLRPGARVDL